MDPIVSTIIAALASPIFLKIVEYVLNKNSEKARAETAKLEALEKRVDEYRDDKVKLEIKIGVLEAQLAQKDRQIEELQREITSLQNSKQNK